MHIPAQALTGRQHVAECRRIQQQSSQVRGLLPGGVRLVGGDEGGVAQAAADAALGGGGLLGGGARDRAGESHLHQQARETVGG